MNRIIRPIALFLIIIHLVACTEQVQLEKETDERTYRRGKSLLREGRKDEALEAFLAVVAMRPDAAESNLESGLLYLNHIKDPLAAIYHFRQYLALKPDAEYSGFVSELIMTAKKDFAASLPGQPFAGEGKRADLMEKLKEQETINNKIKAELIDAQKQIMAMQDEIRQYQNAVNSLRNRTADSQEVVPIVLGSTTQSSEQASEARPDVYTVQTGDTLSQISQKVYGTSGKWMDIFQANRDTLPSPNALKPGQELRIP